MFPLRNECIVTFSVLSCVIINRHLVDRFVYIHVITHYQLLALCKATLFEGLTAAVVCSNVLVNVDEARGIVEFPSVSLLSPFHCNSCVIKAAS